MSTEQMNRIFGSKMIDENDIEMNANNQLVSNRVNTKPLIHNERRVLAPIETKTRNVITGNRNKSDRFSLHQNHNKSKLSSIVSIGNTVKTSQEPIKSFKTNSGLNNGQKSSDFIIFCDESKHEIIEKQFNNNCIVVEENDDMDSSEQIDHSLTELNSMSIEGQLNCTEDITCEESFMLIESEIEESEVENDSNSEQTSEVCRSFETTSIASCIEYSIEIHEYLLFYERKQMPDAFYIGKQPEINSKMRSILVDWMAEVTEEYKLLDETLFLAVDYINRFLSVMSVSRQSFQLLGTAALFISSKYEEIYPPELAEFVYITDDSYSKYQILNMEKLILKALNFDVSTPTIHYFIEKFGSELAINPTVKHMAKYLCHLTLLESEPFLQYYPSETAICAIILSAQTLGSNEIINEEFVEKSVAFERQQMNGDVKHLLSERKSCIEALHQMQRYAHKHPQQAIQLKFASDKYGRVSTIPALSVSPRISFTNNKN